MRKKETRKLSGDAARQPTAKRAKQLERANVVLSSSIENFAIEQGPDAFLDAILHTIASALGVHTVTVWRWTGDDHAHLHRILEHGTVLSGERSDHPHANRPVFLPDYPWVMAMLAEGRHITEVIPVSRKMGLTVELLAYLRARNVRAVITAAIRSGNKIIGSFTARLPKGHPDPGPEQLALMRSLAAHGALALEMGRLTEAARDGAIREERVRLAHEREQAAQERAAELEHVNAVLSSSIENFAIEQGPDAFLDAIMHTIASALDVHTMDMWRWPGDGLAYLHRVLEHGMVLPGGQVNHPNARTPAILANFPWTREVIAGGKQITEIVQVNRREGFDAEQLAHLRARGVRAMITATIRSGNKVIGSFSARLHKEHPDPAPERRALMRSLAAHGALALEMDRLTEAARVGAIREERTRMARDLHDSLAQGFTGIIVQLEGVESALTSGDFAKARARAASAGELARDSLHQARNAVSALRPSVLEDKDLTSALRWLVESTFAGSSIEGGVRFGGVARLLSPETEENLLRIAQEALTNVLKHADARRACLTLNYRPNMVILRIHDDGRGFASSDRRPNSHGGFGLIGIRERSDRLGAKLTIKNQAGGGASINVKLPTPARSTKQR